MRLKARPEDFRVEEVSRPPPRDPAGEYAVFRVRKRGVPAFAAIEAVARALRVERSDVSFAGLKDARGRATQLASVRVGAGREARRLEVSPGLVLEPIGRAARPVRSEDIESNRFLIVVRDVAPLLAAHLAARIDAVRRTGVANYFDDQRFGGASPARGFVAEAWSRGDLRGALELLIARPSPKDPRAERLEKKRIAERFGRWRELAPELKGEAAPIVRRLARAPDDLAGAFRALDARLRALLVAQWQSFLWNEAVVAGVRGALPREDLFDVMYRCGTVAFWRAPPEERIAPLRGREVEMPSFPLPASLGVEARRGARALVLEPRGLEARADEPDDLFPGRRKITLFMELPRGSYATIVAKRIFFEPLLIPPGPRAAAEAE